MRDWLALLGPLVLLLACNHDARGGKPPMPSQTDPPSISIPADATGAVDAAKADAAARTGIEAAAWEVVRLEAVQWPDASLGCSQPGEMYAQVITRGYHIVLSANDRLLEYHSGPRGIRYCT